MWPTGFDLRRDISVEFNTRVKEASFDSKANTWTVKTDKHNCNGALLHGETGTFRRLSRTPNYPGLERF